MRVAPRSVIRVAAVSAMISSSVVAQQPCGDERGQHPVGLAAEEVVHPDE